MDEIKKKVQEIKVLCQDRMDAISADGNPLSLVFEQLEALIESVEAKKK
jgi:hypothetical protein